MAASLPYELFISLRYLRAKRRVRSLSVITVISTAGVTVGVMALIVVMAVMSGFEFDLRNKILGTNAHIWVLRYGDRGIEDPAGALAEVRQVPDVTAASPFTYNEVLLTAAGRTAGSVLRGIDLASFDDFLRQLLDHEEATVGLATVFYPMHRVERVAQDEASGSIPSLADRFRDKIGLSVLEYLGLESPRL